MLFPFLYRIEGISKTVNSFLAKTSQEAKTELEKKVRILDLPLHTTGHFSSPYIKLPCILLVSSAGESVASWIRDKRPSVLRHELWLVMPASSAFSGPLSWGLQKSKKIWLCWAKVETSADTQEETVHLCSSCLRSKSLSNQCQALGTGALVMPKF